MKHKRSLSDEFNCFICSKPHNGSYGSGRYCSVSCSRVAGAKARWNPKKPTNSNIARTEPDAAIHLGLIGERVVVYDGKCVIRGRITEYDVNSDTHRYVNPSCFLLGSTNTNFYLLVEQGHETKWKVQVDGASSVFG